MTEISFPANNLNDSTEAFLDKITSRADIGVVMGSIYAQGGRIPAGFVTSNGIVTMETGDFKSAFDTQEWRFTSFSNITGDKSVSCKSFNGYCRLYKLVQYSHSPEVRERDIGMISTAGSIFVDDVGHIGTIERGWVDMHIPLLEVEVGIRSQGAP